MKCESLYSEKQKQKQNNNNKKKQQKKKTKKKTHNQFIVFEFAHRLVNVKTIETVNFV